MLTLDLNLASRPFKNDTLPWVGLGLAVVALTLLTIWNVRTYRQNSTWVVDLKQQYSATRNELDELDRKERGAQREIEGYDLEALHVRADKANEVILWKAFSWTRLFNLLQEVLPNDVQMISIRPIFRPQGVERSREDELGSRIPVSVEGVSKSLKAFLTFERALIAHANFERVEPEGHTRSRTGSLAFQVSFLYDPGVAPPPQAPLPEEGSSPPEEAGAAMEEAGAEMEEADSSETEEIAGAARLEGVPAGPTSETGATKPEALPQARPSVTAEGDQTEAGADKTPRRPKPPNNRRRNTRRDTAAKDKEGGQ